MGMMLMRPAPRRSLESTRATMLEAIRDNQAKLAEVSQQVTPLIAQRAGARWPPGHSSLTANAYRRLSTRAST
jgi:hypothetical protein